MGNSKSYCAPPPKRKRSIEKEIIRLGRMISHKNPNKRIDAIYELGELGEPAVPVLLTALNDESWVVWSSAIHVLAQVGKPAAPALVDKLGEKGTVSDAVSFALVAMGEQAVPALIEALHREYNTSGNAAVVLGKIGGPAVPALIEKLECPDELARRCACQALGRAKDKSAIDALAPLLESTEKRIKWNAAWALEKIGPRGWGDLEMVSRVAKKMKKEKKEVTHVVSLYSTWTKMAGAQAQSIVVSKKFHVPRIQRVDSAERVLRVRRAV